MKGDLVVLDWACLTGETCDARRIFEFDWGAGQDAVWSPTSDQSALTYFPYATSEDYDSGPTNLVIVDLDDGQTNVIFENGHPALLVRGWSPDGKWLALQNTEGLINHYAIYVVSMNGLFRGIVPNEDEWIEFFS